MGMTCIQCGTEAGDDALFCQRCGAPLDSTAQPTAASGWDTVSAGMEVPADQSDGINPETKTPFARKDLAGWWRRLFASWIDGLILILIFSVIAGAGFGWLYWWNAELFDSYYDETNWWDSLDGSDQNMIVLTAAVCLAAILIVFLVWEVLWTRSKFMGKPGQRACGFRVTDQSGQRLSNGKAIGRAFSKFIYRVPYIGGLIYIVTAITIGTGVRRQALHDMMSGTVCVRDDAYNLRSAAAGERARESSNVLV
jgi:uncharacterized RDD family membrane protein YckC